MTLTAFPVSEGALRQDLRRARVDARSLSRPLARCALGACHGMCCYDGVYLEPDAAARIEGLVAQERPFFRGLGLDLPDRVIVEDEPGAPKTAVVPRPFSRLVPRYPSHFTDTACAFLAPDGRCALQLLSAARGYHPWYYKPIACWTHPLTLTAEPDGRGGERPALVLLDERTDPYRRPGYDGYVPHTRCGRATPAGRPAHEVLREELAFLGRVAGRDLLGPAAGTAPALPALEPS